LVNCLRLVGNSWKPFSSLSETLKRVARASLKA
jgi:hypothetical protein